MNKRKYTVLNIDAWNGPDGWWWNEAHTAGSLELSDDMNAAQLVALMISEGYLKDEAANRAEVVEYSEASFEIQDSETGEPLFALEPSEEI